MQESARRIAGISVMIEIISKDEFPSMPVRISPEHTIGFPGESIRILMDGADSQFLRSVPTVLSLVDEMGTIATKKAVEDCEVMLTIPSAAEVGQYSLQVRCGDLCLDSMPFEVAEERVATLTRKLLYASIRQADAFNALHKPDIELSEAFAAAEEAECLYIETEIPELACKTWLDISDRCLSLGKHEDAADAASKSSRIRADRGLAELRSVVKGRTKTKRKRATKQIDNSGSPITVLVESSANIPAAAISSRLTRYLANYEDIVGLRNKLQDAQGNLLLVSEIDKQHHVQRDSHERGSIPWAVQRLSADVLSSLLADLIVHRIEGIPDSTMKSVNDALKQSVDSLTRLSHKHYTGKPLQLSIKEFADNLCHWSEIKGHRGLSLDRRDEAWLNLRRVRVRMAHRIAKVHWDQLLHSEPTPEISAVAVISPFVDVVTTEAPLFATAGAVSRIVSRVERTLLLADSVTR
jgi:hypothetical protein